MATLPGVELARVDRERITAYLLEPANSRGKAAFFLGFGFVGAQWADFAAALKQHAVAHPVVSVVESRWGIRYSVDGPLDTPSGRTPQVRTVWIVERGRDAPRLITAHPV
jgi:hypothetical protein